MASSIRTGLENLLMHYPNIDAVIICLCDQPFLNSQHLLALQNQYVKTGKKIVASVYDNLESVPALFDKVMFGELLSLKGQEGARKVIRKAGDDLIGLPFSKGIYDVDTPAAWEKVKVLFKE
jgi:molybdenum cofactor cytidylyltransferase